MKHKLQKKRNSKISKFCDSLKNCQELLKHQTDANALNPFFGICENFNYFKRIVVISNKYF